MKLDQTAVRAALAAAFLAIACGGGGGDGTDAPPGGGDAPGGGDGGGGGSECDPIAQTGCGEGQGCYLLTNGVTSLAACADAGTVEVGQPIPGQPFANTCVPGAQPRRPESGSTEWECGGLCAPADVTMGQNEELEGGRPALNCQTRWGAPAPDAVDGESCRYWWSRETFRTPSAFSNTLGYCFPHDETQYDSNGDGGLDARWPRCTTVTTGDVIPPVTDPPGNDALDFFCIAEPG